MAKLTTTNSSVALPNGRRQRRSARKSGASRMRLVTRMRAAPANSVVPRIRGSLANSAGIRPIVTDGVQSRNAFSHWNMNAATQVTSVRDTSGGRIRRNDNVFG